MNKYIVCSACSELENELCSQLIGAGIEVTLLGLLPTDLAVEQLEGKFDGVFNIACIPPVINQPELIFKVTFSGIKYLTSKLIPLLNDGAAIVNVGAHLSDKTEDITLLQNLIDSDISESLEHILEKQNVDPQLAFELAKRSIIAWTEQFSSLHKNRSIRSISISPDCAQVSTEYIFGSTLNTQHVSEIAGMCIQLSRPEFRLLNGINIYADGGTETFRKFNSRYSMNAHL